MTSCFVYKVISDLESIDHLERINTQVIYRFALAQVECTALPAKSDSDLMFVYNIIRDLQSIDHLCINPILRIGLIHK